MVYRAKGNGVVRPLFMYMYLRMGCLSVMRSYSLFRVTMDFYWSFTGDAARRGTYVASEVDKCRSILQYFERSLNMSVRSAY